MSAENWFDPYGEDDKDFEAECKHCGVGGLTWGTDGQRWFLMLPTGETHKCKKIRAEVANDFEDIS